jgi:hypothetical protein
LSGLRRLIAGSARAPLFFLCALVLATVVVPAALADDPPPTTTAPAPDPAPDPAPAPKPKPKPPPRSQPRPTPTPTPPRSSGSSSSAPQPSVVHVQKPVVKEPVRKHVKPTKKVHRKKVVAKKPPPVVPTILAPPQVAGASIGSSNLLHPKSPSSGGLASIFIVIALSFAIASLSIALIPANRVPWRPVAVFVADRQVDLTVAGFALLIATAFTLILTGGL